MLGQEIPRERRIMVKGKVRLMTRTPLLLYRDGRASLTQRALYVLNRRPWLAPVAVLAACFALGSLRRR